MRRVQLVVSAAVCLGLLSGCAAQTSDTPGSTASPTTTASSTPSPTAEAAGPRDLSDPELGVEFTDFPRDQGEQTAAAIETFMLFEIQFWRASTTNTVPPGPWAVASDEAIAWIQAQVDGNTASGFVVGGELSTSIAVDSVGADRAVLTVCRDLGRLTFIDGAGTSLPASEIGVPATSAARITLSTTSTGWSVANVETVGEC